jgi:hypothetical protein
MRFWFHGMNNVRELNGVLVEENWKVVADDIPITLFRIEFDSETANIAHCVLFNK